MEVKMSFGVDEVRALMELLSQQPQLREELRHLLLGENALSLTQAVRELAEAHQRGEERLKGLESAVAEFTKAQHHNGERLQAMVELGSRLQETLIELIEAQKRTERSIEELAVGLRTTRLEQYAILATLGVSLEEEAADSVEYVLRHKGYEFIHNFYYLRWDDHVKLVALAKPPEGEIVSVITNTVVRAGRDEVQRWARLMRSKEFIEQLRMMDYFPPYLVYLYAMRAYQPAKEAAEEEGIGLMSIEGELVEPKRKF